MWAAWACAHVGVQLPPQAWSACRATLGEWVGRAEKSLYKPTLFKKTDLLGQDPLAFPVQGPFALISSIKQASSSSSGVEREGRVVKDLVVHTNTLLRKVASVFLPIWGRVGNAKSPLWPPLLSLGTCQ